MRHSPWNPKLAGERAESAFLAAAMQRSLTVSKPFGDSTPYDFIVDPAPGLSPTTLWRVQVKSASTSCSHEFVVGLAHAGGRPLLPAEADFVAALIVPLDVWYIVPVALIHGRHALGFFPEVSRSCGRWEPFRNAWHLLKRRRDLLAR
jgi:hypothetical protein